jgi:hypothetical protein
MRFVSARLRGDTPATVGVLLSLLNIQAFMPSELRGEFATLIASVTDDDISDAAAEEPLPAGFTLPGRDFVKLMNRIGASDAERMEYLSMYLATVAIDPTFTMQDFVDSFEETEPADAPEPEPVDDPAEAERMTPPWVERPVPDPGADKSPIDKSFSIDLEEIERAKSRITGPTDFAAGSPWICTFPLTDKWEFAVECRGDDDGEPYFEALVTDLSRRNTYAGWPVTKTPFGEYTHEIMGRAVTVTVNPAVAVAAEPAVASAAV